MKNTKRYRIKIDKSELYLVLTKVWFLWETIATCKYPEIAQKEIGNISNAVSKGIVEVVIGKKVTN